jgi:hypothetical protein
VPPFAGEGFDGADGIATMVVNDETADAVDPAASIATTFQ